MDLSHSLTLSGAFLVTCSFPCLSHTPLVVCLELPSETLTAAHLVSSGRVLGFREPTSVHSPLGLPGSSMGADGSRPRAQMIGGTSGLEQGLCTAPKPSRRRRF